VFLRAWYPVWTRLSRWLDFTLRRSSPRLTTIPSRRCSKRGLFRLEVRFCLKFARKCELA
jgi:hypothetical protein